jgi:protein disulfide-isomerase A1
MEYSGGRTTDAIVSWVLKKSGPPSTNADCETITKKVAESKFVMAYFGAESDPMFKDAFEAVADVEDKISFFHTSDAACAAKYNAVAPGIVFFRKFETEQNVFSGAADKEELTKFFKPLMVATLFKFSEEEIEAVFGQQQNTIILFRKESQADDDFVKNFEAASQAHKGKILFAFSDGTVDIQEKLAEFMGVDEADLPTLRAITPEKMMKYKFEDTPSLTAESVGKWVDGILDGSIKPHLKSAAVPESNDGPVKTVVGSQFQEIVMDDTKDVLVKYYAPWCGHCKKLAPIWEELGAAYKDNADLVIADFDATVNEAEGVDVRGYPTLIFYPKGGAASVTYEGDRDLEGFKKWLSENAASLKVEEEAIKEEL